MDAQDAAAPRTSLLDSYERGNVMAAACPSRAVLSHMTSRWGVLVMVALQEDTHRFSALRRRIGGISERMLAQTLQNLEGDRLVHRHALDTVPPHVEYSLTPLGREAAAHLAALTGWIEDNLPRISGSESDLS
ncbi:helix-turn-helix domain-containing protein [Poseidonocella sp. HB161398]|uniref:winged helix-turn-helix transcriptional regulator n=1 Tax=Poseidonocella sp. HB161398 TaxID=2320855 RepID=UPI001109C6F0|nr:helix-turn-helix domain-containing protein [Poseidonocella sp. HB161398]